LDKNVIFSQNRDGYIDGKIMTNSIDKSETPKPVTGKDVASFVLKWGPRTIVVCFVGYYSLGLAYYWGVMALIDKVAISLLLPSVGYAGLGAIMPIVQWYAAWGVRIIAGIGAGFIYEAIVIVLKRSFNFLHYYYSHLPRQQQQAFL
jgi:hypothetical protein